MTALIHEFDADCFCTNCQTTKDNAVRGLAVRNAAAHYRTQARLALEEKITEVKCAAVDAILTLLAENTPADKGTVNILSEEHSKIIRKARTEITKLESELAKFL